MIILYINDKHSEHLLLYNTIIFHCKGFIAVWFTQSQYTGSQMAERLGSQAINQKVASYSIPDRAK